MGAIQDLLNGSGFRQRQSEGPKRDIGLAGLLAFLGNSRGRPQQPAQVGNLSTPPANLAGMMSASNAKKSESNRVSELMQRKREEEEAAKLAAENAERDRQATLAYNNMATSKIQQGMSPMEIGLMYSQAPDNENRKMGRDMIKTANKPAAGPMVVNQIGDSSIGNYLDSKQKEAAGFSQDDTVWLNPKTGPKVVGGRNKDEVQAGVTSDSIRKRMDGLMSEVGKDFVPGIRNSLDQFGVPDAVAAMARTPKGRKYDAGMRSITSDVVKVLSGAAASDEERAFIKSTYTYTPGDTIEDMDSKFEEVMNRITDMRAVSGQSPEKSGPVDYDAMSDAEVDAAYEIFMRNK